MVRLIVVAWFGLAVGTAHAEPQDRPPAEVAEDRDRPVLRPWRIPLVIAESAAVLIPPTIYYWNTTNLQREDWELRWTWDDWKSKLTSFDDVILDTGYWEANALRHPIHGVLSYQVGRANGFGQVSSTAIDLLSAATWEYLVEFKERVSLNDLVVNAVSGFLLGEPLFQIGLAADRAGASLARKLLGWTVSPVHRLHATAGYASWRADTEPWTSFELGLGEHAVNLGDGTAAETALAFDLELVRDPRYGRTGEGSRWTRAAAWNRFAGDVRLSRAGVTRVWLQSMTTYGGKYGRDLDTDGVGTDWFVGAAAGIDYESRRLPAEWDHVIVFHVFGPRVALGEWVGHRRVLWEVAGYGDLAMVQAHVFGPVPPFAPMPQKSVLQSRGYYYATGASLTTRLRLVSTPWFAELEGRAHQMWSIDGHDRVELGGGPDDPHDVADQRLTGRATLGIQPGRDDLRLELTIDAAVRRGTWQTLERVSGEAGVGAAIVVGF